MQSDKYSMAEKILRDVELVIDRDDNLEEFVIIPVTLNQNKSPVVHVEHNLGLESWCVKHVYNYAYQKILAVRKLVAKRKLLHDDYANVNRLILGALLINPDVATFWNMRREFVLDNLLSVQQELKVTKLVLSHKSKSNEAFAYRKWLLRHVQSGQKPNLCHLLTEELHVCNMTAQKSPNNYHSWGHRIWCLENLLHASTEDFQTEILQSELMYSESWVSKHVSEHTGFHYRQFILKKAARSCSLVLEGKYEACFRSFFAGKNPGTVSVPFDGSRTLFGPELDFLSDSDSKQLRKNLVVLIYDLTLNSELQDTFPEHEALWCHRRFVLFELFSLANLYAGFSGSNSGRFLDLVLRDDRRECNVVENVLQGLRETGEKWPKLLKCDGGNFGGQFKLFRDLVDSEKTMVEKCSRLNNRHGYLAQRHLKWLTYILGI